MGTSPTNSVRHRRHLHRPSQLHSSKKGIGFGNQACLPSIICVQLYRRRPQLRQIKCFDTAERATGKFRNLTANASSAVKRLTATSTVSNTPWKHVPDANRKIYHNGTIEDETACLCDNKVRAVPRTNQSPIAASERRSQRSAPP